MANRTATSVLFGFDFQANAAIVLMLENIKDMTSIRLEGAEDIEINLNDGSCVLAQAKSVVNSSSDFTNVLSNLKKSITSLSEVFHENQLACMATEHTIARSFALLLRPAANIAEYRCSLSASTHFVLNVVRGSNVSLRQLG